MLVVEQCFVSDNISKSCVALMRFGEVGYCIVAAAPARFETFNKMILDVVFEIALEIYLTALAYVNVHWRQPEEEQLKGVVQEFIDVFPVFSVIEVQEMCQFRCVSEDPTETLSAVGAEASFLLFEVVFKVVVAHVSQVEGVGKYSAVLRIDELAYDEEVARSQPREEGRKPEAAVFGKQVVPQIVVAPFNCLWALVW